MSEYIMDLRKIVGHRPLLQVGASVIVVDSENRILLQLRSDNHCWAYAGGSVELDEVVEDTARRELLEETGLHARLIAGKKAISEYDIPPYTRKQVVLFLAEVEGNVIPQEAEVQNYQWVKAEELEAYLHSDTYRVCRELLR